MNDRSFVLFVCCTRWVTSSRVVSTKTVDYVLIYENKVFYYTKSLGSIVNFPNG